MQRYLNNAILIDLISVSVIGLASYVYCLNFLTNLLTSTPNAINGFNVSLITVSATLLGFLLTIITVIVTFKKAYQKKKGNPDEAQKETFDKTIVPETSIFERKISVDDQLYGTVIHKQIVMVFKQATYEISFIIVLLLLIQFNSETFTSQVIVILSFCAFILLTATVSRSLYIFNLFLNAQLEDEKEVN